MSVSALHRNFKAVTANSLLQYLKSVRLQRARLLMLHDGLGAALAADRVGYESRRSSIASSSGFLGNPPIEKSRRLLELLEATPSPARAFRSA